MESIEEWKEIPGYDGVYQVSNLGNVKSVSVNRFVHGVIMNIHRERTIRPFDNGHGYLVVSLNKNNTRKNYYVHRLVAEMFVDNPNNGDVVNHIDFDTKNNNYLNLQWCSQKENVQHSINNMKVPKKKCKPTNTGEKYICKRNIRGCENFILSINNINVYKSFKTLEDAVQYKERIMNEIYNTR